MFKAAVVAMAILAVAAAYGASNDADLHQKKSVKAADCDKDSGKTLIQSANGTGICRPDSDGSSGYGGLFQSQPFRKNYK